MFTEFLKIIPKIEGKDLSALENSLNKRFTNIAKKFGGGIVNVLKGGGIAGIAIGLIDKILNPLKEVEESIARTLQKGDDLSTFAKQFNTSSGNLARLQAFGKAAGLDPEGVRLLLGKFQGAVAQAAANPEKLTAVSAFVGKKDTAEAFFEFIQSVKKLTPIQKSLVQAEVFGEKQILKASEFLNQDFGENAKLIGGPSAAELTQSAERLGALSDMRDILTAKRELQDLTTKAKLIGPQNIAGLDRKDALDLKQENKNLGKFKSLEEISMANQRLINVAVNAFLEIAPLLAQALPKLAGAAEAIVPNLPAIKASRMLRGVGTGKKDE